MVCRVGKSANAGDETGIGMLLGHVEEPIFRNPALAVAAKCIEQPFLFLA
jgi:hypothetical protein